VIDDEIAPAIQVLNRRGYFTTSCCAAHPLTKWLAYNGSFVDYIEVAGGYESHITFKVGILLPTLPPGFSISQGKSLIITRHHADRNFFERMRGIVDAMEQLYEWAMDLPDFKDLNG